MAPTVDRTEILRGLRLYHQAGDTFEIRIPDAGKAKTISGYFTDFGAAADAVIGRADEFAVYVTINPTDPRLIARANNRLKSHPKSTTGDSEIRKLNWLPMDGDPPRPAGISSTDEEHGISIEKCKEIKQWLIDAQGWPERAFVIVDSGNGGYLLCRVELENKTENSNLVKKCLEALDYLYTDETFHVDTTSANPARILRVPGTMNAKGDEVSDMGMKHRMAKVLDAPRLDNYEVVTKEKLEALAAMLPEPEGAAQSTCGTRGAAFDPVAYCQAHNLRVHHTKGWTDRSGAKCTVAVLEQCIFNPDHHLSAVPIGWPNGMKSYRCRHNSCLNKHWKEAKAVIEPACKPLSVPCDPSLKPCKGGYGEDIGVIMGPVPEGWEPLADQGITEEEFQKLYGVPCGPRFELKLPKDHFLMRYMAYGQDLSDGYPEYWFMGGLHALSVVVDKKIFVKLRQMIVWPNLYLAMLGKSTISRKSTISDKTEDLLMEIWPFLNKAKVPTEFSPEAFLEHMNDNQHAPWIRDEAAGVLNLMKKEYMSGFKENLMILYDCRSIHRKLRTSQRKGSITDFNVDDPYLNILWATTGASFAANTEQNDTLSGFLARFCYAFPQRPKDKWLPLEEGSALNSDLEDVVKSQLLGIANDFTSRARMPMHLSPEAAKYFNGWQFKAENDAQAIDDDFSAQIYGRLAPTVLKFCMLFEVGSPDYNPTNPIRLEFMQEACRLVDEYFMVTAKAVYEMVGADAEKNQIVRIKAYLTRKGGKATAREILRKLEIKRADFEDYLDTMLSSGEVSNVLIQNKGARPTQMVCLNKEIVSSVHSVHSVHSVPFVRFVSEIQSDVVEENIPDKPVKPAKPATHDKADNSSVEGQKAANSDERLCAKCHKPMGMSAIKPGLGEICMDCLEAST